MFCKNCGKEIDDNAVVCIHCGASTVETATKTNADKSINAFGIVGFVLAILSMWLGTYFCIAPLLALIFSCIGIAKMKNCRVNGLAVAGLVISIITLIVWLIVWIVFGMVILSMM